MHRKLHPFPDLEAFGPDDDLISRKDLAKLLGVHEFALRNWENAGLMPARASVPAGGVLLDLPQVLWRAGDLRDWAPRMIGVVFRRPPRPKGAGDRRLEWQAGRGWVEPPPVERSSPPVRTRPRRSTKIPDQHVVLLGRLEAQLAGLERLKTPEVLDEPRQELVEEPRRRMIREEPEPQPFASNIRRPTPNHARYWG